jgi:hypothetical protein
LEIVVHGFRTPSVTVVDPPAASTTSWLISWTSSSMPPAGHEAAHGPPPRSIMQQHLPARPVCQTAGDCENP